MTITPIIPVGVEGSPAISALAVQQTVQTPGQTPGFAALLMQGLEGVNQQLVASDNLVQAFAVDDSIPLHQVTFALEQSRLSFELLMQVRGRLVEGYQEMMRMQL